MARVATRRMARRATVGEVVNTIALSPQIFKRLQSKQEELTEEEEMKQQQRMAIMEDLLKKIRSKGRMPKIVGGFRSCLRRIVRKHGPTQDGRIPRRNGTSGWNT